MKKKFTSLLLVLTICCSLLIPANAAEASGNSTLSVASLSTDEITFFEELGVDFDQVASITYSDISVSSASANAQALCATASSSEIDVLQFQMEDDDLVSVVSVMFTDDIGNPVSAQSVIDYGLQISSGSQNYLSVTAQYRLRTTTDFGTYINPNSISFATSTNCTNVGISYYARGNRCSFSSGSPVVTQLDTEARISNSYATVLQGRSYTTSGSYTSGYALPYNEAIELVSGGAEAHGVTAYYTTSAGVYYYAGIAFDTSNT